MVNMYNHNTWWLLDKIIYLVLLTSINYTICLLNKLITVMTVNKIHQNSLYSYSNKKDNDLTITIRKKWNVIVVNLW